MYLDDRKVAAELLCTRMKERVEGEKELKKFDSQMVAEKLETDCLYYWILSCLEMKMYSRTPAKTTVTINVTGKMDESNKVLLKASNLEYLSFYTEGEVFFEKVEEVISAFWNRKNYSCEYYRTGEDSCEFWVSMSVEINE